MSSEERSERPRLNLKPRDPNAAKQHELERARSGNNPFGRWDRRAARSLPPLFAGLPGFFGRFSVATRVPALLRIKGVLRALTWLRR